MVNTEFIDNSHAFGGNAQLNKSILAFQPKPVIVYVRQKPAPSFVMCVGNVVATNRPFACDLTFSGHVKIPYISMNCGNGPKYVDQLRRKSGALYQMAPISSTKAP
jgi:hypothetical protein